MSKIDEIETLAKAATPGPWRSGRLDMRSFNAATGEQFKNIYGPNFAPATHLGQRVPEEVAKAVGDYSLEDAAFIAAANPQTILRLIAALRSAKEMRGFLPGSLTAPLAIHAKNFDAALAALEAT